MSVLREYHKVLGSLIHKHGGTVERFTGDGIMMFFNDPVPCVDPSLRAAQMAIEMRDQVGEFTTKWHKHGHELGFGMGIAHGYATLGPIGFEGRLDYGAVGTVVNLAARLCAEAGAGQFSSTPRCMLRSRRWAISSRRVSSCSRASSDRSRHSMSSPCGNNCRCSELRFDLEWSTAWTRFEVRRTGDDDKRG